MSFPEFAAGLAAGEGEVLFRERVADLDTPVGAFLRLVQGRPNAFLLESVEGGATRGRFSSLGLEPDLIWRCRDGRAEVNRHAQTAPHGFITEDAAPVGSLRALVSECRMKVPAAMEGRPACSAISVTTWSARSSGCRPRTRTCSASPRR
jgi:anthranilate synthase component 1